MKNILPDITDLEHVLWALRRIVSEPKTTILLFISVSVCYVEATERCHCILGFTKLKPRRDVLVSLGLVC